MPQILHIQLQPLKFEPFQFSLASYYSKLTFLGFGLLIGYNKEEFECDSLAFRTMRKLFHFFSDVLLKKMIKDTICNILAAVTV